MLEKIRFVNHMNEEMIWGEDGAFVNCNDLHDYSWDVTKKNNKIASFSKGVVKKTIPLIICCSNDSEGLAIKNRLMEIAEKDILANTHGKIIIGDYYLKCFITGSKKKKYLINKRYLEVSLTVTTDYPQWVRETATTFRINGDAITDTQENKGKALDYNYDFPHDYTSGMINKTLNNSGFIGSNFKLIIYGSVINPAIHIAGHTYEVECEIGKNEYLTIDSLNKTIVLTKSDGTMVNCFNLRNRDSYIFKTIPSGKNVVLWDNSFGFDVILFEERSEPKWT